MNAANTRAETVMGWINAFRSACLMITVPPEAPLARANFTYSESSTSSIDERVSRRYAAQGSNARINAGVTKCLAWVSNGVVAGAFVAEGNHCRYPANNKMHKIANQNAGVA